MAKANGRDRKWRYEMTISGVVAWILRVSAGLTGIRPWGRAAPGVETSKRAYVHGEKEPAEKVNYEEDQEGDGDADLGTRVGQESS